MSVFLEILATGVVDSSGTPVASGTVYAYSIGTTTKVDLFTDQDLTVPASNPYTLDAGGRAELYTARSCRLVVQTSAGAAVADWDAVGSATTEDEEIADTSVTTSQVPPIGAVLWFYDFDELDFDTDNWAFCNGQSLVIGSKVRQTPDCSNRYIVGFGTEGGQDVGSATWATAVVGNSGHTVDDRHTHSMAGGSLEAAQLSTSVTVTWGSYVGIDGSNNNALRIFTTAGGVGSVTSPANTITGTSAQGGSAALNIQPRSIRMRAIMRVA